MARDKISEYDATASSNTVVADVNIAEGCPPSGINDAIRQVMAALKRFQTGADGDTISAPVFIGTTASITTANIVNAAVSGTATFNGATIMSSSLSGTTANFSGATTIGGAAVLSSTANITGATTIGGAAVLSSTLNVTGASTFSTANITGATTIGGAAVLSSTLNVTGATTLGSTAVVSGEFQPTGGSLLKRIKETTTVSATAAANTINYDMITQSVLYYTTDATANWVLNVRGDGSTTLNSIMSTGQSATVVFLATQGSTAYYQTALQVDGSSVTPKWQGGSAPTAGNASGVDAYVFTIIKTADATFTALGSQTQFA